MNAVVVVAGIAELAFTRELTACNKELNVATQIELNRGFVKPLKQKMVAQSIHCTVENISDYSWIRESLNCASRVM